MKSTPLRYFNKAVLALSGGLEIVLNVKSNKTTSLILCLRNLQPLEEHNPDELKLTQAGKLTYHVGGVFGWFGGY